MNIGIKKKFQSKSKGRIGLDIGSSSLKMLEINNAGDKPLLVCLGMRNVPSAARENLVESIKSLAEEMKVTTKDAAISVSGSSVIVRFVSMPKMKEDELNSAMRFEAEKYIPFSIDDCIVDYQVLKKNEREGKLDVLLVAAKKDFVMERIGIVEEAGLSVSIVDVDSFAAANTYSRNFMNVDLDKTVALINIGASFSNVSIVKNSMLCFVRDVAIGGNDFNSAISKALDIDMKSAEDIKISPKGKSEDITACTKGIVNNLLDEIRLSFSYHENQSGDGIEEIYVSGGSAKLIGMGSLFKDAFDSNPSFWDPLQFLDKTAVSTNAGLIENAKSSFAIAAGLALR